MFGGLSPSQLATKAVLFRGSRPWCCQQQKRYFRNSKPLLGRKGDKPPIDLAKVKEQSEYVLRKIGGGDTMGKLKASINSAFRTLDVKMAEQGFKTENAGIEAIRYLIAACMAMWLLFFLSPPGMKQFLANNFLISGDNSHRLYPLVTSMLLHTGIVDLLFSSMLIYAMGPQVMAMIGATRTWQLIIGSTVVSNFYYASYEGSLPRNFMSYSIPQGGLSSAAHAIVATTCFLRPHAMVQFFFIPVQSLHVAYLVTGIDFIRFFGSLRSQYSGGGAHVGGAMFGAGYWYFILKQTTFM